MEHLTILGGEQYLGWARSRVKALRAAGHKFARNVYEVPGATITVRLADQHEYIRLEGGLGPVWVMLKWMYNYDFVPTGTTSYSQFTSTLNCVILKFRSLFGSTVHEPEVAYAASAGPTSITARNGGSLSPIPEADAFFSLGSGWTDYYGGGTLLSDKVPHQFAVCADKMALHYSVAHLNHAGGHAIDELQQAYVYAQSSDEWVYTDKGFPSGPPTFFKNDEFEYSLGVVPDQYVPWTSWKMGRTGGAVQIIPATNLIWPAESTYPPVARLASRTADEPKYSRREGRWLGQGMDFISTNSFIDDRRMNWVKTFDSDNPSNCATLDRSSFIRFHANDDNHGQYAILDLCRQKDGELTRTVIKQVDLRTFDAVSSRAGLLDALNAIPANGSSFGGYGVDRNRVVRNYAVTPGVDSGVLEISIMPDQAAQFTQAAWFESSPVSP